MLIEKTSRFSAVPFPAMRNFVLDTLREGRHKDIIYMLFEMDITTLRTQLTHLKFGEGVVPSLTAVVLWCYAKALDENKRLNSYRQGKHTLIQFDDVDVAVMVEKAIEGQQQPIHYIVRNANRKTLAEIHAELKSCKESSFEQIVPKLDRGFFAKVPTFLRNVFWKLTRKDPQLKKQFSGTVGLTSVGMFGTGTVYPIPITPMTTTLGIGTIALRPVLNAGKVENHEYLCATLCVDHAIVDGSPMIRFLERFKTLVEAGLDLPQSEPMPSSVPVSSLTVPLFSS